MVKRSKKPFLNCEEDKERKVKEELRRRKSSR